MVSCIFQHYLQKYVFSPTKSYGKISQAYSVHDCSHWTPPCSCSETNFSLYTWHLCNMYLNTWTWLCTGAVTSIVSWIENSFDKLIVSSSTLLNLYQLCINPIILHTSLRFSKLIFGVSSRLFLKIVLWLWLWSTQSVCLVLRSDADDN